MTARLSRFLGRVRLLMGKEFLQMRRDRAMIPLLFVMPVMQLLMFGYVVGADVKHLPTGVVDLDRTSASRELVRAFSASGYFDVNAYLPSEAALRESMDRNRVGVAVVIPAGYAEALAGGHKAPVEIVVDGSDSKTAQVASGYSGQIIASLNDARLQAAGLKDAPGADVRVRVKYNPSLRAVNAMIPGLVALVLMLSTTAIMGQAVVKERERGTLEQLFVTPVTRLEYLVGKITPYAIVAVGQITVIFTVGTLWFKVPFNGSALVVASGLGLFMLMGLGQGLFVSTVSRTRQQAQQATMFMLIPSMVLSGFIFPLESMPSWIRVITYAIPLRYILVIMRSSFMKGSGFAELWPQFAAMGFFSATVFLASLARFRKRLAD